MAAEIKLPSLLEGAELLDSLVTSVFLLDRDLRVTYLNAAGQTLVGLSLNETWNRNFAHNIKFNEYVTLTPTFNVVQAYSAVANANFVFPVYKKLNFTLSSTDNYLGDPPEGYRRNSFQFTAGATYVVK